MLGASGTRRAAVLAALLAAGPGRARASFAHRPYGGAYAPERTLSAPVTGLVGGLAVRRRNARRGREHDACAATGGGSGRGRAVCRGFAADRGVAEDCP